jgi:hypothetical protein
VITEPGINVEPQLYHVSGLETDDPKCSVHIIGCTDDWFGNWDGLVPGSPDHFISKDLTKGRLVEVIDRQEPAFIVCHWPGIYFNGAKTGFNIFKEVVARLNQKYNNLIWMKNSEIARYWAAKKLTRIEVQDKSIIMNAPFGTEKFTVEVDKKFTAVTHTYQSRKYDLGRMDNELKLKEGTFCQSKNSTLISLKLEKGLNRLEF